MNSAPPAGIVRKIRRALVHASGRDRFVVACLAACTAGSSALLFTARWNDAMLLVAIAAGQLVLAIRDLVNGLRFIRQNAHAARRPYIRARQRRERGAT